MTFSLPEGDTATLDDSAATILAEELRLLAAGERGDVDDPAGARGLADAIEARLTADADEAVVVETDGQLGALYRNLNVAAIGSTDVGVLALYRAARTWHDARL